MKYHWTFERLKPKDWAGKGDPRWAQAKLDGWRITLFKDKQGQVYAFGRETWEDSEMLAKYPRLWEIPLVQSFAEFAPPHSAVDCEVYTSGPASEVTTALRDAAKPLQMTVFAVPFFNGEDLRYQSLPETECLVNHALGVDFAPYWWIDRVNKEQLLALAKANAYEGFVLKRCNYFQWWKLKEERVVDCVVSGVIRGKGKFKGLVGSLECQALVAGKWRVVAYVSGMSDTERVEMTKLGGYIFGKVVEVKYQYVGAGGKLRHPRFSRWRPDKPTEECTLEI